MSGGGDFLDVVRRRRIYSRQSSCEGKARFSSPNLALRVLRRRSNRDRPPRQVYRCHHCGGWHLGGVG
jgi:hypothetical protein